MPPGVGKVMVEAAFSVCLVYKVLWETASVSPGMLANKVRSRAIMLLLVGFSSVQRVSDSYRASVSVWQKRNIKDIGMGVPGIACGRCQTLIMRV